MGKSKKRTIATVITMVVFAIIILLLYNYWSNRTDPLKEASVEDLSEVEKLLDKDLELYYPETPRELVKLYNNMLKVLHTNLKDDEVKALALKIRELYDEELLSNNSEEEYLINLYTEITEWKKSNRRITSFILINEDLEQESIMDGRVYSVIHTSYTFQEKGKFTETWKFMVRLSEDKQWKILGWDFVPKKEK